MSAHSPSPAVNICLTVDESMVKSWAFTALTVTFFIASCVAVNIWSLSVDLTSILSNIQGSTVILSKPSLVGIISWACSLDFTEIGSVIPASAAPLTLTYE